MLRKQRCLRRSEAYLCMDPMSFSFAYFSYYYATGLLLMKQTKPEQLLSSIIATLVTATYRS